MYTIYEISTWRQMGTYKTRKRAMNAKDKLDMQYSAINHTVKENV